MTVAKVGYNHSGGKNAMRGEHAPRCTIYKMSHVVVGISWLPRSVEFSITQRRALEPMFFQQKQRQWCQTMTRVLGYASLNEMNTTT